METTVGRSVYILHYIPQRGSMFAKSPCGTVRPLHATADRAQVTCKRCLSRMATKRPTRGAPFCIEAARGFEYLGAALRLLKMDARPAHVDPAQWATLRVSIGR